MKKKNMDSYQIKFLIIILIPMIFLISYSYLDRKRDYESYIKTTEQIMAEAILKEESFIDQRLNSSQLLLFQDKDAINEMIENSSSPGIKDVLAKFVINRLDYGAMGIFSWDKNEIVFHIGQEDIYHNLDLSYIENNIEDKGTDTDFYINYKDYIIYIIPFEGGFIYSYHVDVINRPSDQLFISMIIIAITLAILAAKWVESRTRRRIYLLKKELEILKVKGGLLPIYNDKFGEIAKSVNELKVHLSRQEKLLHNMLDSLPLGIIYYDENGEVEFVNKTATKITGYSEEEIMKFTSKSNILKSSDSVFWETLRSGQSFLGFESYCPTKDGREIPVMTSTNKIYNPTSNIIGTISSFFDISEQERLRDIEQKAKVMLDHISDGVMMVDNEGVINGFNRGAEEMTGLKAEQVLGRNYDDIFIKRKTIFTKLTQTLETKIEYTNYKKETTTEDNRKVYLMITTKILRDEDDKQVGAMGIYKDITHIEELSQQMQRADKLAVVGELAAGTAHEIRNPLTTIKGFIQLLKKELKNEGKGKYVDLILNEINSINEIIREMLLLAKPIYPKKSMVNLNHTLNDIVTFMSSEALLHNIQISFKEQQKIPYINVDERQIKQVFINIIRNAIQSMEKSGNITVTTSFNEEDQKVLVIFEDEGAGIPESQLAKIYEPFFTTKTEGTGLGIPVSYQIMKNHGGDLQIASVIGVGTKVILYFPLETNDSSEDWKE